MYTIQNVYIYIYSFNLIFRNRYISHLYKNKMAVLRLNNILTSITRFFLQFFISVMEFRKNLRKKLIEKFIKYLIIEKKDIIFTKKCLYLHNLFLILYPILYLPNPIPKVNQI